MEYSVSGIFLENCRGEAMLAWRGKIKSPVVPEISFSLRFHESELTSSDT